MKKLILLVLTLSCIFGLVGCSDKTYELPHDQFCYSADGVQRYELNINDKQYVIDLLNSASWENVLSNCTSDFVFYTQNQEVRYHSESGTFDDYTNNKSTTVSEEQRSTINAMFSGCNNTADHLMAVDGLTVTNAITDNENVKIVIDKISNSDDDLSITIKWVNNSHEILQYGNPYKIEFHNGSSWENVDVKENVSWTLEGLLVYPADNTDINIENTHEIRTFNVSKMFDLEERGKYRLTSTFNFVDETQKFTATIEFELT